MNEMLLKYYPQLMIIAGIIFQIWGGTILFHRTQEYRKNANSSRDDIQNLNKKISENNDTILNLSQNNEKLNIKISSLSEKSNNLGEENKALNYQIRNLSTRISDQSKIIENQITGGDSYGEVSLLHIGYPNDVYHNFYLNNRGDYPLYDVTVTVRNQKKIKEKIKSKDDEAGIMTVDDLQDYKTYQVGNIPANGGKSFGNLFKLYEDEIHYYGFSISSKNRSFSQLYKFLKKGKKYYIAVYVNTIAKKGEKGFKVLVDKADEGFPNEENGKIEWEDK